MVSLISYYGVVGEKHEFNHENIAQAKWLLTEETDHVQQ